MAHISLFWLSYLTASSMIPICVADTHKLFNISGSATNILNKSMNPTEVPYGISPGIPVYCNGSSSWVEFKATQIVPNCRAADAMLQSPKIWGWGYAEYEFIPRGVQPTLIMPVIRTPLRVSSGDFWPCTIAIVNLNTVPAPFLDSGGTRGPYPKSDTATYYDIQVALSEVWSDCVYGLERQVGWAVTGKANSLGVFMFDTRSDISKAIPNGPTYLLDSETENLTRSDTQD